MTLKKKAIIFFLSFFLGWFVLNSFVISKGIMKSYDNLEQMRFEWTLERVHVGIDDLINKHLSLIMDWSKWDEAYKYVQYPELNESFERDIDLSNHFEDQQMNYYVFYGGGDRLLLARGYDLEKHTSMDVPEALIQTLPNYRNESGLLLIEGKPIAFVTHEVTNNDGSLPSRGLFAFAYDLTETTIEDMGYDLREKVVIGDVNSLSSDFSKMIVPTEERDFDYGLLAYPYKNVDGKIVFQVELNRYISELGMKVVLGVLFFFAISFMVLVIVIMTGVTQVARKIGVLNHQLSRINKNGHLTERVKLEATDELGTLRDAINDLLDELQDVHGQLLSQATYDDLTGVLNRRAGLEQLEQEIVDLSIRKSVLTIVFVDVNGLKTVNDTYGHHIGDDYLIHVCHAIKMVMSLDDNIARLGGDEFLIIFPNKTKEKVHDLFEPVHGILQKIHDQFSLPYEMSISAGVFEYDEGLDIDRFIEHADELMYREKMARRQQENQ